jgi:very-short-patch-repair endonuclease
MDRAEGRTRSWLERRFRPLTKGLPKPLRNHLIRLRDRTIEADNYFKDHGVIVELDGRTYHEREAAYESDRSRDSAALAARIVTMRVTWRRLRDDADGVRADLVAILSARAARPSGR